MKVVSYFNVVPSINKSQEKFDILTKFVQGVNAAGDQGILHTEHNLVDCDVGVIQGWQHQYGKTAPHLRLREMVINRTKNRHVCCADSNLFLFANKDNKPFHYLRYSFDGVFPDSGQYFDDIPDSKRWTQISTDLGIQLQDYKNKGKNIVFCLQRNGGWSMGPIDVVEWCIQNIKKVRAYTERPIILRPHPKDKSAPKTYLPILAKKIRIFRNVKISNQDTPLEHDLNKEWAVVNHNSSSIVGPIIYGIHAFVTDPIKSQCRDVANTDFSLINNPQLFDREQWLNRVSMFHWKFSELEDGTAWKHMRNYVRQ